MKRIILSVFFAGSLTASFAQQPPLPDMQGEPSMKNWLIYGDFGFNYQNNSNLANNGDKTVSNYSINPGLGYRLNEHLTVGLQGGVLFNTTKYSDTIKANTSSSKSDQWTFGVFLRHNCCDMGRIFYFYHQLNLSYVGNDNNAGFSYNTLYYNSYGYEALLFPALGIRLPHDYSLELNLGGISYSSLKGDNTKETQKNFNITFGQSIKIGISKEFNFHNSHVRSCREPGDDMHRRSYEKMSGDDEDGGGRRESPRRIHDMDDE